MSAPVVGVAAVVPATDSATPIVSSLSTALLHRSKRTLRG